jgi:hypothetical protein
MGRLLCIAAISVFAAAACSAPSKRPLTAGYYIAMYPNAGVERRIVIVAGDRRASYDVWRVSTSGDGNALHAHYDLIAADAVPSSGSFEVTQDGSDCGTLTIEPYSPPRSNVEAIEVRRGLLGVEHFVLTSPDYDPKYADTFDAQIAHNVAQIASAQPRLYSRLSIFYKFVYGELTPSCTYD